MVSATAVLDQAMELSPQEREDIAIRLLMSIADGPMRPLSKAEFEALLLERAQQVKSGEVETVDAFEALERARQQLRRRSE